MSRLTCHVARRLSQCSRSRCLRAIPLSPCLNRPLHSSPTLNARKGRRTAQQQGHGQPQLTAEEIAANITDSVFPDGIVKRPETVVKLREAAERRRKERDEQEAEELGDERKAMSGKGGSGGGNKFLRAKGIEPDLPERRPLGEMDDPTLEDEFFDKGYEVLPRTTYVQYGIEPSEERGERRSAEKTYYETNETTETDTTSDPSDTDDYSHLAQDDSAREAEIDSVASEADKELESDWYVDKAFNLPEDLAPAPESFIPRWMKNVDIAEARGSRVLEEDEDLGQVQDQDKGPLRLEEIVAVLKEEHGTNLVVIDMRSKSDFTDYMVIVEGRSRKHIYNLADAVRRKAKFRIPYDSSLPQTGVTIEGRDTEDWMVLDTGRFILHCFTREARALYNLEGLWTAIKDPLLHLSRQGAVEEEEMVQEEMAKEIVMEAKEWGTFRDLTNLKEMKPSDALGEDEVTDSLLRERK
ncbi:hypothetical protein HK104_004898 [Borealophlyctis nickersoniae]|nr:hypothetical protein HK104_004898 [Borealophlyctis nickersoniae]